MMTVPLKSAALLILDRVPTVSRDETPSAANVILAAANGVAISTVSDAQSQAKAKISDALFESPIDIQQMKLNLMRRLGDELGINMDDFEGPREFGSAVREVIGKIKAMPNGATYLMALEKELGLDKLGVSLDDLVDAISSPDGEGGKTLDAALRAETGEDARDGAKEGAKALLHAIATDEMGLYGV